MSKIMSYLAFALYFPLTASIASFLSYADHGESAVKL